jgi:hypothetical protein
VYELNDHRNVIIVIKIDMMFSHLLFFEILTRTSILRPKFLNSYPAHPDLYKHVCKFVALTCYSTLINSSPFKSFELC